MARKRMLSPEFFVDEDLNELEPLARIAFQGLWCHSDRRGVFRWRPERLKYTILPKDNVVFADLMEALVRGGFIVRFEVDGAVFGWVPTIGNHNHFHHKEAVDRDVPSVPEDVIEAYQADRLKRGKGRLAIKMPAENTGEPDEKPVSRKKPRANPGSAPGQTRVNPSETETETEIEKTAAVAAVARERARDDDRGGGMSSTKSPPTALAIANPGPPRDRPPRRKRGAGLEHVRGLLPEAHHRRAFTAYAEQHRHPGIFAGVIAELIHGREPPDWAGGPTWEPIPAAIVGQALHEMAVAGAPCTEHVLQAFIEPLLRAQSKPPAEEPISGIFPSMAREYARLGDESWIAFCRDHGIAWEQAA